MLNKLLLMSAISLNTLFLTSCATKHATTYPIFTPVEIGVDSENIRYKQKTHTVFTLLDTFSSVNAIYDSENFFDSKFTIQKQILNRVNKTIPQDLPLHSGMRSFGFGECVDDGYTRLLQDIMPHARYTFQHSIDKATCASGRFFTGSPMGSAISDAHADLDKAKGNIALLIISDGYNISYRAKAEAESLKMKFADRLCIYSIWVDTKNKESGRKFLRDLSDISKCGESIAYTDVGTSKALGRFVEDMLFDKENIIKAPEELFDTDNDGIFDPEDVCPGTPQGAPVNVLGCWSIIGLEFDFDKSTIRPEYEHLLSESIRILKDNLELNIRVNGHTDNRGSKSYNLFLSDQRADAVKEYLINKGISKDRLTSIGVGEEEPIADNATVNGSQLNRRVTFTIIK